MSKGKWDVRSHLSADRYKIVVQCPTLKSETSHTIGMVIAKKNRNVGSICLPPSCWLACVPVMLTMTMAMTRSDINENILNMKLCFCY